MNAQRFYRVWREKVAKRKAFKKMRSRLILACMLLTFLVTACAHTIHKREPREEDLSDRGTETSLQLRGPRAVLIHKF